MFKEYIILSGNIASGKSTLAKKLSEKFNGRVIKTNDYIKDAARKVNNKYKREDLQKIGERLDRKTKGQWVVEHIQNELNTFMDKGIQYDLFIIDSVRIENQIESIRKAYGQNVLHIHLEASVDTLSKRYNNRDTNILEARDYSEVQKNRTERNVKKLSQKADVVIDTDKCDEIDVFIKASSHIRLSDHTIVPLVDVLVGAQYGSEGKGNIAAFIAPEYDYLVRVGGPNAGHKVYDDPIQVFNHLPSGTLKAPNAHIVLGPGMVIGLDRLLEEIRDCELTYDRLSIDPKAMIIEESDIQFESKNQKEISSTGKGVGSATARRIQNRSKVTKDSNAVRMAKDIKELLPYVKNTADVLEEAFEKNKRILLEGTQGTSLSLYHGEYPHVTSRDTTVAGCLAEAGISPRRVRKVLLVVRTYPIRVGDPRDTDGTSGHMKDELTWEEISQRSNIPLEELLKTELTTNTRKLRRVAEFNWQQLKQSVILNAPTDIALTFIDYLDIENRKARRFEQLQNNSISFIEDIERVSGVKVSLISTRFHWRSIIDRRSW